MAGAVPVLWWFDRFDDRIGILPVVGELVHTEELNGEDTIEFETREVPTKGDRLLWQDGSTWREHVVVRTDKNWRHRPQSVKTYFGLHRDSFRPSFGQ